MYVQAYLFYKHQPLPRPPDVAINNEFHSPSRCS